MHENRQQAYLKLIQALLESPPGKEAEILQVNEDLLDEGFLVAIEAVVKIKSQQGDENAANWLRNLADVLKNVNQRENLESLTEESFQAYWQFLVEVLKVIADSNDYEKVVYSLLAKNTVKLDLNLAEILKRWGTNFLSKAQLNKAKFLASIIFKFSTLIQQFPVGNRANNLEIAIAGYNTVLTIFTQQDWAIYTQQDLPHNWAATQNNLGNAYIDRIIGDKAQNIEDAIKAYQNTLIVCTQQDFPQDWAMTQNNLGNAYSERIIGHKAQNVEDAIKAYENALIVYSQQDLPQQWAMTQNNLGAAYRDRIIGDEAQNIEDAIKAYENALIVYSQQDLPQQWAMTQNNLGNAYSERIIGHKAQNVEDAIKAYENALIVITQQDLPQQWAGIQNNLGVAYSNRIIGHKAQNIEDAIKAHQNALQIYTPRTFPTECVGTARNLGNLTFANNNWVLAIQAYEQAIQAVEQSQEWSDTEQRRQEIQENIIDVYRRMVQACINLGEFLKALSTVERSKARNLVELLVNRDYYPKGNFPDVNMKLNRLRRQIAEQQRALSLIVNRSQRNIESENNITVNYSAIIKSEAEKLNKSQQDLNEFIDKEITPIDPTFKLGQRVEVISFKEIQSLLDKDTAIVQWYITGEKILTFITTPDSQVPDIWESSKESLEELLYWVAKYIVVYREDCYQWQQNITTYLQELAKILHLDEILQRIPQSCKRLILIPHWFLHLFPLHALQSKRRKIKVDSESFETGCLIDLFPGGVSYAPSCQILQLCQNQGNKKSNHKGFFVVENPTLDLDYMDLQVAAIRQKFNLSDDDILVRERATKAAVYPENQRLASAEYAHFACHGYFNFESPLNSGLLLAESLMRSRETTNLISQKPNRYFKLPDGAAIDLTKCLTLGEIFALNLTQCHLVTLSACETGLTDLENLSDEYIGLPSGFLFSGSPNVVSSLWRVNLLSTALLMIKFYQNHDSGLVVNQALNQAQIWLRDATKADIKQWAKQTLTISQRTQISDALSEFKSEKPFNSPYYWAAFCTIGK